MSENPTAIVVMGVSGSGKSTIGRRLADALGYAFLEGDDMHPPANIARMSAGVPLDDADRVAWLEGIAGWMEAQQASGHSVVVACSALKRAYRERLRQAGPAVCFVYLRVGHQELARRMRGREHFMPPALLGSQLATLEEPGVEESALTVDANGPVDEVVARVLRRLERQGPPGAPVGGGVQRRG